MRVISIFFENSQRCSQVKVHHRYQQQNFATSIAGVVDTGGKKWEQYQTANTLKVDGNEKVGRSGMCHSVPFWLGPRRSRFVSLSILPSSLILSISVSASLMQND
jgi:hypothetical protein